MEDNEDSELKPVSRNASFGQLQKSREYNFVMFAELIALDLPRWNEIIIVVIKFYRK